MNIYNQKLRDHSELHEDECEIIRRLVITEFHFQIVIPLKLPLKNKVTYLFLFSAAFKDLKCSMNTKDLTFRYVIK